MKIVTTIVITEEVNPIWENQVRRNFERSSTLDGSDITIKNHLQQLIPVLKEDDISVDFRMEEGK